VEDYQKILDSLPDHPDRSKNHHPEKDARFDELSKEMLVSPEVYKSRIEKTIEDNKENTACRTCPQNGKCKKIKWDKDHSFIKVTGCSGHPNQRKFPGKSVTVELTDNVYAGFNGTWENSWVGVRNGTFSVFIQYTYAQGLAAKSGSIYYLYRGLTFWNTDFIPDDNAVNWSILKLFCPAKWLEYSTRNATCILTTTGNIPPTTSNYNRLLDLLEVASIDYASVIIGVYNNITLPPSCINKVGYTKLHHRHSGDVDDEAPPSNGNWGVDFEGSTGAHPPKLELNYSEYNTPSAPTDLAAVGYDRGIKLSWTPPTETGGGDLLGYKIYAGNGPDPTTLLKTIGPSETTCEFPISNRKTRFYRVTAIGPGGDDSPYSNGAYGRSAANAPDGFVRRHLIETVTIRPREGSSGSGKPQYGDGIDVYSRVQYASKNARDNRGETILSKCQIQVDGSVDVDSEGAIEFPDGKIMPILEVREYKVNAVAWMKEIYT